MTDTPITELFTHSTQSFNQDWAQIVASQDCAYLERRCLKVRKSQPEVSIGTCSVSHGAAPTGVIICPHRYLERGQIFLDCLHLLTLHEPGNELHKVSEIEIPGGSVDYFLVSVRAGRVVDFVGIELQAVDTTGTLWPPRQRFLQAQGLAVDAETQSSRPYGMNWKMTAKTTLVQLHHKVETFENLGKHLVLVLQDRLTAYIRREFNFSHIQTPHLGHAMHFHSYALQSNEDAYRIQLVERSSTDAAGISQALGLQASANVELDVILAALQKKLSRSTLLQP